jgi:hypothetical protein
VLKRKFVYLQWPFQMYDVGNIAEIVYCCFVLHNMAVEECILAAEDTVESAAFYDCVEEDNVDADQPPAGTLSAMAFIHHEDEALCDRQLEVRRLFQLGIDIYDPSIAPCSRDADVLDLSTQLAHQRWKNLYDYDEHKWLQKAIVRELKNKYVALN